MADAEEGIDDPLSNWLRGDGPALLDLVTASALDVIGVIDKELKVRYLNWTAPGLTREGVVGLSVLDLVPPNQRAFAEENYRRVLATGNGTHFEAVYKDGDNVQLWDVRIGPIRVGGEIVGLVAITTDVTEQRRADVDRDRFFSLSLDLLIVVSPEMRFKRLNPAFGEALGRKDSELIATRFIDLVHPDDRIRTSDAFERILAGTRVTDFENRYRHTNGEYRVFSWQATVDPVTGDVYAVARDVTDHRVTEAQLRHAQKMEAVGQLAGGVAHDFNNLLLAILANVELATQSAAPGSEIAEHLSEIEGAALRASDLTKQLLAFSRRKPLRLVAVDLNRVIRGLMKMLGRLLPESIHVDFIPGHHLAEVSADPSQLEQVIVNLCVNARDAMERGGELTLETENILVNGRYCEAHPWAKPGRYVLLSVTDTGIGMTGDVRERAFEPFFTTKSAHQGTGLGLSTVYGIVQQHAGMIHLYSEPGVGTTFKIYLPADTRFAEDVGDKLEALPPRGQETILVAEDEEQVRRAVVHILERAGYRTLAVSNGVEALRLLRERTEPVHLLLFDVVMPELGGPEAWEQLRRLRSELRVIFTSGYADDRQRHLLPPDATILEKPFRAEQLLHAIREKLDAAATRSPKPGEDGH
jgi:PAS domain S-box-containing protein